MFDDVAELCCGFNVGSRNVANSLHRDRIRRDLRMERQFRQNLKLLCRIVTASAFRMG